MVIFVVAAAVSALFFINLCGTIYQCGCVWMWAGAADHCNIHAAHGRHCPICVLGNAAYTRILLPILAVQAGFSFLPRWVWQLRLFWSVVAFPATFFPLAFVLGLLRGYWN